MNTDLAYFIFWSFALVFVWLQLLFGERLKNSRTEETFYLFSLTPVSILVYNYGLLVFK